MAVSPSVNDVLSIAQDVAVCVTCCWRSTACSDGKVVVVPSSVPPQLVDVVINPSVDYVLRVDQDVSSRVFDAVRCRRGVGEVVMVPSSVPPQLVDVVVITKVDHVLCVTKEDIADWVPGCHRRVGSIGEVVVVPSSVPPQLVDVTIRSHVYHVLGIAQSIAVWPAHADGACTGVGEVVA